MKKGDPKPAPRTVNLVGVGLPAVTRAGVLRLSQRTYLSGRHLNTARTARDTARALDTGLMTDDRLTIASHVVVATTFSAFAVEAVAHEALLAVVEDDGGGHYFRHLPSALVGALQPAAEKWLNGTGSSIWKLPDLLEALGRPPIDAAAISNMGLLSATRNKLVHATPGETRTLESPTSRREQLLALERRLDDHRVPCLSPEVAASAGGPWCRWPDKWMCAPFAEWAVSTAETYLSSFGRALGNTWW